MSEATMGQCRICLCPTAQGYDICGRCEQMRNLITENPKSAAKILGSIAGSSRSPDKIKAARKNGRKSPGRPHLPPGVKGKYTPRKA